MGPHFFKCGNILSRHRTAGDATASMGPHFFKCGNSPRVAPLTRAYSGFNGAALFQVRKPTTADCAGESVLCFNGAALFQVRKPQQPVTSMIPPPSFNGAALFQVRKQFQLVCLLAQVIRLQWGRTFSSAETGEYQFRFHNHEGLQWGRTFSSAET